MATNADALGTAINTAIVGLSEADKKVALACWKALAGPVATAIDAGDGATEDQIDAAIAAAIAGPIADAIADAIAGLAGGGRALGATVAWTQGTGAGQISFGAAAPNGSLGSATGCDEGGKVTFTTGSNTSTGAMVEIHFAQAFPNAPSVVFYPGDAATAALFFGFQMFATSTTAKATLNIQSAPANATYTVNWQAKGFTP